MKKKLLIITPHLSTGGAPQVTLNKIQLLKDEFEIKCVEYRMIAWIYVVQRNQIINILGDNFHSLGDDKETELFQIIRDFKPDIVSLEEFPEFFMDDKIAQLLYERSRTYRIFETTHDSSFPVNSKRWFPDEFVFVSAFNAFRYSKFDIPYHIIEYPVDIKEKRIRECQDKLGFDPEYKHVVNVGLFTPRKNQKYIFDIAKKLKGYKIKFHFLGNQADNFKFYWEPIMKDKPNNCVVWGEKSNVDEYLQASDLFLFTSRGDRNNKELNPIAIKEALEYQMPMLMFNLDVYCGKYDEYENITYLTGDIEKDTQLILDIVKPEKQLTYMEDEFIIISTYPNTIRRMELTKECITSFRKLGRKIIVVSHYPLDEEIQNMADFYLYDPHNPMIEHSYYSYYYNNTENYDMRINLNGQFKQNQSLAAMTNFHNGVRLAKSFGASKVMIVTYDVILQDEDIPLIEDYFSKVGGEWKCAIAFMNTEIGKGVETTSMVFKTDYFQEIFPDIRDEKTFNDQCKKINAENFLEDYFYKLIKDEQGLWVVPNQKTILPNSGVGVSSQSEYFALLPIEDKPNEYMFYFHTYNIEDKLISVHIFENRSGDWESNSIISQNILDGNKLMIPIEYRGNDLDVIFTIHIDHTDNSFEKSFTYSINEETKDMFKDYGYFKFKNQ